MKSNNNKEYKCIICAKEYKDKSGIWYHNKKYHTDNKNKMTLNNDTFILNNLKYQLVVDKNQLFKCKFCDTTFTRRNNLNQHIKNTCKEKKKEINLHEEIKKIKEEISTIKHVNKEKTEKHYKCINCPCGFDKPQELDVHLKMFCKPAVNHNSIYTFKTGTFGRNKYAEHDGGDIYIIQTDFNLKHYYKIGITTDLYSRINNYRCGAVLEPRIHYYFPIKNIKKADSILKLKLEKYNIKREIYKCENLNKIKKIIKSIQSEFESEKLEVCPELKDCDVCNCKHCDKVFTSKYELSIHYIECSKYAESQEANDKSEIEKIKNENTLLKIKLQKKYIDEQNKIIDLWNDIVNSNLSHEEMINTFGEIINNQDILPNKKLEIEV